MSRRIAIIITALVLTSVSFAAATRWLTPTCCDWDAAPGEPVMLDTKKAFDNDWEATAFVSLSKPLLETADGPAVRVLTYRIHMNKTGNGASVTPGRPAHQ